MKQTLLMKAERTVKISTFPSGEGGPSRKRWWMRRAFFGLTNYRSPYVAISSSTAKAVPLLRWRRSSICLTYIAKPKFTLIYNTKALENQGFFVILNQKLSSMYLHAARAATAPSAVAVVI